MKNTRLLIGGLVVMMFFILGCAGSQVSFDAATGNKNIRTNGPVVSQDPAITGKDLNDAAKSGSDATQAGYDAAAEAFKSQMELVDRANTRTVIVVVVLAVLVLGAAVFMASRRQQPIIVHVPVANNTQESVDPKFWIPETTSEPKKLNGGIVLNPSVDDPRVSGLLNGPGNDKAVSSRANPKLKPGTTNQGEPKPPRNIPLLTDSDFDDDPPIEGEVRRLK